MRGRSCTGITLLSAELAPKQLQLLHELIPNAALFGVLADPGPATQPNIADLQAAARELDHLGPAERHRVSADISCAGPRPVREL
jgi:hypothetical protein